MLCRQCCIHLLSIEADAPSFMQQCSTCEMNGTTIHVQVVELHGVSTLWPFHTGAFDLSILYPKTIWILVAIECYARRVKEISLKKISGVIVESFIRKI